MKFGIFSRFLGENLGKTLSVFWLGTPITRSEVKQLAASMGISNSQAYSELFSGCEYNENSLRVEGLVCYDPEKDHTVLRVYTTKPSFIDGRTVRKKRTFVVDGRYW